MGADLPGEEPLLREEGEPEESVHAFLASLADEEDWTVDVYRARQGQKAAGPWCFRVSASEVDLGSFLETLRDHYSGGLFRVQVRNAKGELRKNRVLEVEPPPPDPEPAAAQAPAPDPDAGLAGVLREVLEELRGSRAQDRELLLEAVRGARQPAQPALDPIQLQSSILEMIRSVHELAGPRSDDGIETFLRALEVARSFQGGGGGGGESSVLLEGLRMFGPQIVNSLQTAGPGAGRGGNGRAGPPRAMAPAAAPEAFGMDPRAAGAQATGASAADPSSAGAQPAPEGARASAAEAAQSSVLLLLQGAQRDADPYAYATVALDAIGEEAAWQYFGRPGAVEELAQAVPQVQPFLEWFREFGREVAALLAPEDGSAGEGADAHSTESPLPHGDPRGPGGDPAHPAGHAPPGGGGEAGSGGPGPGAGSDGVM